MYETFFDITESLCERYTSLNPFIIRKTPCGEVFLLINRINRKSNAKKGIRHTDQVWTDSKGNTHIRREAKNDNWY